jgi:TPR repeat protein
MPDRSAAQPPADATTRPATAPADSGTGQEEFNAARDILRSGSRQRQLSVAVELLWSGVRKGYVPAEVTLADLYRRGDGVEKNCDQARVLLVAASKKGSFDARQMLEQMAERGCD